MTTSRAAQTQNLRANLIFALAAIALSFLFTYFRFALNPYYGQATPAMLVEGTAFVPFQYRVLIPLVVRALTSVFSLPILNAYQLIELAASIGLCYAVRHLISFFVPSRLWVSLAALGVFYCAAFNFMYWAWFPWDIPSVLFFTLGLAWLYRGQWRWYYPLFIVATLNRETSIFLTLSMVAVTVGRGDMRGLAKHTAAQLGLWTIIKLALYFVYGHNPRLGYGVFEPQIIQNWVRLSQPDKVFRFFTNWGFVWIPVLAGRALIKDRFVRRLLVVPIVQIGALFFVGVFDEIRIYGESIPIVLTAFAIIAYAVWRRKSIHHLKTHPSAGQADPLESNAVHA